MTPTSGRCPRDSRKACAVLPTTPRQECSCPLSHHALPVCRDVRPSLHVWERTQLCDGDARKVSPGEKRGRAECQGWPRPTKAEAGQRVGEVCDLIRTWQATGLCIVVRRQSGAPPSRHSAPDPPALGGRYEGAPGYHRPGLPSGRGEESEHPPAMAALAQRLSRPSSATWNTTPTSKTSLSSTAPSSLNPSQLRAHAGGEMVRRNRLGRLAHEYQQKAA